MMSDVGDILEAIVNLDNAITDLGWNPDELEVEEDV